MKFTLISAVFLGLVAFVFAEDENHYFFEPAPEAEFTTNDKIHFVMNSITNDADEQIIAELYSAADDSFIKQIGCYTGDEIVREDDMMDWSFDWVVDVPPGSYYVRLFEVDADGGRDDDNEHDDAIVSHDFYIRAPQKRKRATLKRSQLKRALALEMA